MTVNKIITSYPTQNVLNDRISDVKSRKSKDSVSLNDKDSERLSNSDLQLSDNAKKLQETEAILRNALQKLQDFDDIREEDFSEIKDKIDAGFYEADKIKDELSSRILNDNEILAMARTKIEEKFYLQKLRDFQQAEDNSIDLEKIERIKQKISQGLYDDPETLIKTADSIFDIIK
ncbi:MAG: flagellar biosynthesis anti-sigma factor FlgM [Candidatus Cloacimonetes bacterium]|nr:flagellar biosynthesis anti-sigma factor FlgM [Candidatus Cloacimonadota bacterium]